MDHESETPVVVFTSGNYVDAIFAASVLTGSEIEAFVLDDNICRLCPQVGLLVGGAKVIVEAVDAERAREILASVDEGTPLTGQFLSIPLSEPAALVTIVRNWFRRR